MSSGRKWAQRGRDGGSKKKQEDRQGEHEQDQARMGEEKGTNVRSLDWSIRKQRTQTGTSGAETRDWNIPGRYGLEGSGQHQGEEVAAARRKGEENMNKSKMGRTATAEAGTGLRQREGMEEGGKGGAEPRRRGGGSGDRTRRGRKEVRQSSAERSQLRSTPSARRPVTRAVVVGSIPTSSARGAHLKTSIVPGLGRWNSCNMS